CRVDDRGLNHRNQCGDLSERIQPRHAFYSVYSRGDFESRRRAVDRVRSVRFWAVRNLFWLERVADRGLVHAWPDDFASDHYRERRIVARGAERIARGLAGTWCHQLANHPQERSALRDAWNFDLFDPRHRPRRR